MKDLIEAIKQEKVPKSSRTVEDIVWNDCIDYIIESHLKPYKQKLVCCDQCGSEDISEPAYCNKHWPWT